MLTAPIQSQTPLFSAHTSLNSNISVFTNKLIQFIPKKPLKTIKDKIKKISLILLKIKALKALLSVNLRLYQKLINKNDVKPISSQPQNRVIIEFPETKTIIPIINQTKFNKNWRCSNVSLKYTPLHKITPLPKQVIKTIYIRLVISKIKEIFGVRLLCQLVLKNRLTVWDSCPNIWSILQQSAV